MIKVLGTYIWSIVKKVYFLVPSVILVVFDIAERWFNVDLFDIGARTLKIHYTDSTRQWFFWVMLGVGFFIASFLTYYDVRRKLDEISEEFYFEPTGNDLTTVTGSVLLNVSFRAKPDVIVDKLELEINRLRFQPSKWNPIKVSPQYTDTWTFDLAEKLEQEKTYTGKLIATVNNKSHESREFKVHL